MRHVSDAACFFFNDTATTEIYTLSLHDALPIFQLHGWTLLGLRPAGSRTAPDGTDEYGPAASRRYRPACSLTRAARASERSEEHTSELQSRQYIVCRLLLEKKTTSTPWIRIQWL